MMGMLQFHPRWQKTEILLFYLGYEEIWVVLLSHLFFCNTVAFSSASQFVVVLWLSGFIIPTLLIQVVILEAAPLPHNSVFDVKLWLL